MDYLSEAKNGSRICLDELRIDAMTQFLNDLKASNGDYISVFTRIYYAGYSVGFKDAQGISEASRKADKDSDSIQIL